MSEENQSNGILDQNQIMIGISVLRGNLTSTLLSREVSSLIAHAVIVSLMQFWKGVRQFKSMMVKGLVKGKSCVGGFFLLTPVKVNYGKKKYQGDELHWRKIKLLL